MITIKNIIFITTMIYAGIYDYKTREIPNLVHIIILLASFLGRFNLPKSLAGLFFISIPFIIPIYFDYESVGGGDIKLSGAIGFFLGLRKGLTSLIVGLTVALIVNKIILKKDGKEVFPLGPYLALGSILSLIT